MKAYQWNGPGAGLVLTDVPKPSPAANEVQIQIQACGLCHSDRHILDGSGAQWVKQRPITLGHEICAIITELSSSVTEFHVGQRVGIALIAPATAIGLDFNGGYAEYAVAPAHTVVPLPEGLNFEKACVAVDAIASAYHSVVVTAETTEKSTVAVLGLGGLGSVGLRVAYLQGATVYGFDIDESKFAAAKENGALACYKDIKEAEKVEFDIVMDFVGIKAMMLAAIDGVKREGRIVLVGMGQPDINLPMALIVMKNIEIRGSLGGRKPELPVIFDLIATGKLNPVIEEVPFMELNAALTKLADGKATARMHVKPNGAQAVQQFES